MLNARRWTTAILLLLAFTFVASLTVAHGNEFGPGPKTKRFSARGEVTVIDPSALTMTVNLIQANRLLRDQVGLPVEFQVSKQVKVKTEGTEPGVFDLGLDDVQVGDNVRVLGKYDGTVYLVTHMVVFLDD
jgi:hypothetical protein